jgi:hypothetical protein
MHGGHRGLIVRTCAGRVRARCICLDEEDDDSVDEAVGCEYAHGDGDSVGERQKGYDGGEARREAHALGVCFQVCL